MKEGRSRFRSLLARHSLALGFRLSGLRALCSQRLLSWRQSSIFLVLASAWCSLFIGWPAWADVAPYFVKVREDSTAQTIQDWLADFSSAQLFLVAGCVIVAMEAVFFVGLLRARKRHGDK